MDRTPQFALTQPIDPATASDSRPGRPPLGPVPQIVLMTSGPTPSALPLGLSAVDKITTCLGLRLTMTAVTPM